jgi:hypothetical protein
MNEAPSMNLTSATSASDGAKARLFGRLVRRKSLHQTSLLRLQLKFSYPLELAKTILQREKLKKEAAGSSQTVWEKRLAYVDLKRKFPSLNDKIGDELLVDKERPAKRPEVACVFFFRCLFRNVF